jgi:phage terminase large subunit GpA-like protein
MYPIDRLFAEALKGYAPPPDIALSKWSEENFVLPEGSSARPGRFRLWPYQRGILDAIGDPDIERVTVIKSSRVGYTKCLMAGIGATAALDPCAMILLVPTDDDARGYAVDEVEPSFEETPALSGLLRAGRIDGRNTLTIKSFVGGGSLKILAARSPRNLRRHDAKKLFVDEEDGMELTAEGDPVALAEIRTLAHADRKIVRGSTPTDEESTIAKAYAESDRRVYEVPCPHCGATFEILWPHIIWPKGEPEKAVCYCPHCFAMSTGDRKLKPAEIFAERPQIIIPERYKAQMVNDGVWVARAPDVKNHAGFRLNTMISLLPNARWGLLAQDFEKAKRAGPSALQVFANTTEGRVWTTTIGALDEEGLLARVEDFGIKPGDGGRNRIPPEVVLIGAGVDTQDDRFEAVLWGFSEGENFLLDHNVIWGDPADATTQAELDAYLKTTWQHPNGWTIGVEFAAVDSQGHRTQAVYDFCGPKLGRRIYAIVSRAGSRKIWQASPRRKDGVRTWVVGHDQIKTQVLHALALPMLDEEGEPNPGRCRFSSDIEPETFDQLAGEKRVVRYVKRVNRPVVEFRRTQPGQPVEALDGTCYCFAAKHSMRVNWAERRARRGGAQSTRTTLSDLAGKLNR